jgi:hypothetical protein
MRHESEFFGDQELVLVYLAKRLKEALGIEETLDAGAMDYAVVPSRYVSGVIFRSEKVGAFFYVPAPMEESARALLTNAGYTPSDRDQH